MIAGRDQDGRDRPEREKKTFSELDRMRRERRAGGDPPRGEAAGHRSASATQQYLRELDGMFGGRKDEVAKRARAMLDARGTPDLPSVCRGFLELAGLPVEPRHVSCFLDAGEPELVLAGLRALEAAQAAGSLETTPGLRTQLRMLVEDSDDEIAGMAEELLEAI